MPSFARSGLFAAALLSLGACSDPFDAPQAPEEAAAAEPVAAVVEPAAAEVMTPGVATLEEAIAGEWRGAGAGRDAWRHPAETLEFLGVDPTGTIIEIWPGSGWYTDVLAPWVAGNGGHYVAGHFLEESTSAGRIESRREFTEHVADAAVFGNVAVTEFGQFSEALAEANSADAILTFRNVHNWMAFGYAEKAFADFFAALKPGGILGVVDHRLPATREQDPQARSGYVQQAYVIALAQEAGFELVAASEINANPLDTADHPFGVWTLPPVRRSAERGHEMAADFDRAHYDAIGESDRMTLLFRKPDGVEVEAGE